MDLGLEFQKTIVGIKINILKKLCLQIFGKNGQLWIFRSKFAQKGI